MSDFVLLAVRDKTIPFFSLLPKQNDPNHRAQTENKILNSESSSSPLSKNHRKQQMLFFFGNSTDVDEQRVPAL